MSVHDAPLNVLRQIHSDAGESQGDVVVNGRVRCGEMPSACATCGTHGEYGTPWPCETSRLVEFMASADATLRALVTDVVTAAVQHPAPDWLTGEQGDALWDRLIAAADMADPRRAPHEQEGLDL